LRKASATYGIQSRDKETGRTPFKQLLKNGKKLLKIQF
jgi:hypothetical protein